jgi:hypothetical protein
VTRNLDSDIATGLAKNSTIRDLITAFQLAEADIRAACALFARAEGRLDGFCLGMERREIRAMPPGTRRLARWDDADETVEGMARQAWAVIIQRSEIRRQMSVAKWNQLADQLRSGKLPPITPEAVADFVQGFCDAAPAMHQEAITEVFEFLRPRQSKLKTNTELEIGRKVVLHRFVEQNWPSAPFHVRYDDGERSQKLVALENVLRGLDGQGTTSKNYTSEIEAALKTAGPGGVGETALFEFRACKNQNLHLIFKRSDLIAALNRRAGGKRLRPEAAA